MKLNSKCMACQIRKQEAKIRHFNDEDRKKQYMEAIRQRFEHPKDDDCVPSISTELKKFYCSFWGVPMTSSVPDSFLPSLPSVGR